MSKWMIVYKWVLIVVSILSIVMILIGTGMNKITINVCCCIALIVIGEVAFLNYAIKLIKQDEDEYQ